MTHNRGCSYEVGPDEASDSVSRAVPKPRRIRDPEYVRHLREMPCAVCVHTGEKQTSRTEAHHVKTRGSGGGDDTAVPCCSRHHKHFHLIGRKSFAARYGIDLAKLAAQLYADFQRAGWAA